MFGWRMLIVMLIFPPPLLMKTPPKWPKPKPIFPLKIYYVLGDIYRSL
jgi:hypothetical protein